MACRGLQLPYTPPTVDRSAELHLRAAVTMLKELPDEDGSLASEAAAAQRLVPNQLRVAKQHALARPSQHALAHRQRSKLRTQRANHESIAPVSMESLKVHTHLCRPSLSSPVAGPS